MPSDPLVVVRDLVKVYKLFPSPKARLVEWLSAGRVRRHEPHRALDGVSFDVREGECFGIIGRNGAGKSTLLQILAGITHPTAGSVRLAEPPSPLLQIGAGTAGELTGRENIRQIALYHGIDGRRLRTKIDEIVDFADLAPFIDRPLKTYSTGMAVRLAFAVTTCLDPRILLVDEVLAVGDVFFRQKCFQRLERLQAGGTAIILVSHDLSEIAQFCGRVMLLEHGRAAFLGAPREAVARFVLERPASPAGAPAAPPTRSIAPARVDAAASPAPADGAWLDGASFRQVGIGRFTAVAVHDAEGRPKRHFVQGEEACISFEFACAREAEVPIGGILISNAKGAHVFGINNLLLDAAPPAGARAGQRVRFTYRVALSLEPGEYAIQVGFSSIAAKDFAERCRLRHADLHARIVDLARLDGIAITVDLRPPAHPAQLTHYGAARLDAALASVAVLGEAA